MSQSSSAGERVSMAIGLQSFRSIVTAVDLKVLWGFCFISAKFHMVLTTSEERIHVPPVDCIGVYEEAMMAGLRFSLHLFMKRVIDRFFLSLAQVALNS